MNKIIFTAGAPAPIGPYSQAVMSGDTLYCSGQIPLDAVTGTVPEGIEAQTEKVIENIKAVLGEAGLSMSDVVKTTCFLQSMSDFAVFNEIYASHFVSKPARSCVEVSKLPKDVLVEIELIAKH